MRFAQIVLRLLAEQVHLVVEVKRCLNVHETNYTNMRSVCQLASFDRFIKG